MHQWRIRQQAVKVQRVGAAVKTHAPLQTWQAAFCRQDSLQLGVMHQQPGPAMLEHVVQTGCLLSHAQGHGDRAQAGGGQQAQHELDAVAQQQRHAVPGLQAQRLPACRQAAHQLVECEVGEARVVADQRRALWVARHGIRQQRMQAARTRREAAHIALEMRFGRDGRPVHFGKRHDSWP